MLKLQKYKDELVKVKHNLLLFFLCVEKYSSCKFKCTALQNQL